VELKGFIGQTYKLQSSTVECQRTINLYPQMDETGEGKNVASLLSTPGLKFLCNLDNSPARGMITTALGRFFVVSGRNVIEVFANGNIVHWATVLTAAGHVGMAENGKTIMIVDGPNGYGFDLATNAITNLPNFPGGQTITFQDGYFIFNQPGTQTFWLTGLYSTTINPLDFESAEGSPDLLVALLSDHRELWLFGTQSVEVWFNSGNPLFPFSRIEGAFITHGTAAAYSPAKLDNTIYWLGQDESGNGIVWRAAGYQPLRCSTHAVEQAIAKYSRIDDAIAWTYQQEGHSFYVLTFPTGNATWVYDAATHMWHERAHTQANGFLGRHLSEFHTMAFGKHFVNDYASGNIYQLDTQTYTDAGTAISKIRTSPYISGELRSLIISRLQLDIEVGVGLPDGTAAQCMLRWSDDGGRTWSNEYWVSLGKIGQTLTRAIWRRLGKTRQRVFQVTITDPIPVAIIDAYIEMEACTS
jgi:hypothetical protein